MNAKGLNCSSYSARDKVGQEIVNSSYRLEIHRREMIPSKNVIWRQLSFAEA